MGYRITLYRAQKSRVDSIRNITDKDIEETEYDVLNVLKEEEIKHGVLAHVLDTGKEIENKLCSRLFNNNLSCECDLSFYTISKEQLLNIIEYIRKNNIYDWEMGHSVDYDKKIIGKDIRGRFSWEKPSFDEAIRSVCVKHKSDAESWNVYWQEDKNGRKRYLNIDTSDNKWWITNGTSYNYAIFNFIHILKIFDWENDYLIALGG